MSDSSSRWLFCRTCWMHITSSNISSHDRHDVRSHKGANAASWTAADFEPRDPATVAWLEEMAEVEAHDELEDFEF